ncbi:RNA polymerase sigma factor [Kordiimonas sp.]|uniref:RNA polymerase sigma factor n=1 Tax=Kordiimonas sp. TaxID=1970157 RepID=UPI003A9191F2
MTIKSLFETQYRKYGPEVQNFIARYVGNYSTAEDLTHEVFINSFRATRDKDLENPRAYLFAAARNHVINHFRTRANRHSNATVEFDELVHGGDSPAEDQRIEARDELKQVIAAVRTLPPRAQQAFLLNRLQQLSYQEVGQRMGISPRTVENHVAKALLVCARYLADSQQVTGVDIANETNNITDLAVHRSRLRSQATDR